MTAQQDSNICIWSLTINIYFGINIDLSYILTFQININICHKCIFTFKYKYFVLHAAEEGGAV